MVAAFTKGPIANTINNNYKLKEILALRTIGIKRVFRRTAAKEVAPITKPYEKQSITTGQEKTPSLMECGRFLIRSKGALSIPRPNAGGELVSFAKISTGSTGSEITTYHVHPQDSDGAQWEDADTLSVQEAKPDNKKQHFGDVGGQQM